MNYYYKGKTLLEEFSHINCDFSKYKTIDICAYNVNTEGKLPFQRFLLTNQKRTLSFPQVDISKKVNKDEIIIYLKICMFNLLMEHNYEEINELFVFEGFYEYDEKLYAFFDISQIKTNYDDIYTDNKLWFALIDEIVNHRHVNNLAIHSKVINLFLFNDELIFLMNAEQSECFEIPIVSYVKKPREKLKFIYTFGQVEELDDELFGSGYYFTDLSNAKFLSNEFAQDISEGKKYGIVRFAIFTGTVKYIETDFVESSNILDYNDEDLNCYQERFIEKIKDTTKNWMENYDSIYLGSIELDNGIMFKKNTILAIKDYNQQVPLSYHYINTETNALL